jgi:hypothetical protein
LAAAGCAKHDVLSLPKPYLPRFDSFSRASYAQKAQQQGFASPAQAGKGGCPPPAL